MSEQHFEPKVLESQGKSIDEAIFKGIQEMGLSIDEVKIETLQEGSKGLLGLGAKPFIVRLTQRNPDDFFADEPASQTPPPPRSQESDYPSQQQRDNGYQQRNSSGNGYQQRNNNYQQRNSGGAGYQQRSNNYQQRNDRGDYRNNNRGGGGYNQRNGGYQQRSNYQQRDRYPRNNQPRRNDYRNRYDSEPHTPLPSVSRVTEPVEYKPYVPGESEILGADFLLGMLAEMGVQARLEYYQDEQSIKFYIHSNSMGILIGHRGETLDALQYLTSLVINKELEGYIHVMLDTEGYRAKREESLIRLAQKMAAQVVATGRDAALEPMNPYERRVLHAALQSYPGVTTYSEGEEGDRHVIITVDDGSHSDDAGSHSADDDPSGDTDETDDQA